VLLSVGGYVPSRLAIFARGLEAGYLLDGWFVAADDGGRCRPGRASGINS
jgi:hypothetical protein